MGKNVSKKTPKMRTPKNSHKSDQKNKTKIIKKVPKVKQKWTKITKKLTKV